MSGFETASARVDAVGILGELEELYPEVAVEESEPCRDVYPELFRRSGVLVGCGHYPGALGRVVESDRGVVWAPAETLVAS